MGQMKIQAKKQEAFQAVTNRRAINESGGSIETSI